MLRKWDTAFKDSLEWVLDDVPLNFEGANQLKVNKKFERKQFDFYVNQKVSIFAAVSEINANPLPKEFEFTDSKLSVLRVNAMDQAEKPKAIKSFGYKIYQYSNVPKGVVDLKIKHDSEVNIIWFVQ